MIATQYLETSTGAKTRPSTAGASGLWASRGLSHGERQALDDAMSPAKSVEANVDLVREGERADSLFIVVDGCACRYATTRDGARLLPALAVPGDIGNLDTLMFERLDYGVRTIGQATVATLPRTRALALAAQYPGISRMFTWLALVENAMLSKWAVSLGRRTAKARLAHLLCELSVRLGGEDGDESSFAFPFTQEQLADALGLTSVHVNRTMQHLRNEGLVEMSKRTITLPNVPGLRQMGGFDPSYLRVSEKSASGLAVNL